MILDWWLSFCYRVKKTGNRRHRDSETENPTSISGDDHLQQVTPAAGIDIQE